MKTTAPVAYRRPSRLIPCTLILLVAILRAAAAHAQTSCLIYSFADGHTGCQATATSAAAAVAGVFACDAPKFCGTSNDTLDGLYDPAQAGKSFLATVTYHASPGCGVDATATGGGTISAATGSQCPVPQYFVADRPPPQAQCGACTQAGAPVSSVGHPINPVVGNVFDTQDDVVLSGPGGLRFQRFYNSEGNGSVDMGVGWRHSYSRNLIIVQNQPYVPYPPSSAHSSAYSSQQSACTSGFAEIQSSEPSWASASVSWNGTACVIQSGGASIGTLQVLATAQSTTPPTNPPIEIDAVRDDGTTVRFTPTTGGVFSSQPGMKYQLQQTGSGYTLTDPDDTAEAYNTSGVLESVTTRSGRVQTLGYDSSGHLTTVADSFGSQFTLGYDSQSRLISVNLLGGSAPASCLVYNYVYGSCNVSAPSATSVMTGLFACFASQFCSNSYDSLVAVTSDPATAGQHFSVSVAYTANGCGSNATSTSSGSILSGSGAQCSGSTAIQYGYDAQNRLRTVWYPDASSHTFAYENTTFPQALTGEFDEAHSRLSTWGYDSLGRATSTQEAGGADAVTLVYNSPTSVTETDALGAVRTFTYQRVGDQYLPASISGSQCPTCVDGAATTYDSAGFLSSRTDYNGNLTCYANDPARGLELVRVEGLAPGSTCPGDLAGYSPASGTSERKITTVWHATFSLPLTITETTRTTSFTYDSSGNELTRTITDTKASPNVSRTWTYTYDSFGRVLSADGPRTDVADITTYTYYSCTTGYQCGQLHTLTDALGHITTFNAYDAYGRPLSVTGANGATTALTYDPRGRVLTRSTAGETTSFSYYSTGLLQTVTLPDGSSLSYTYDAAHRLTQVSDGLGNKEVYTLDAMGNRTAEKVYDPAGTLHRTHTRVINTLNEVYQEVNAAGTAAVTTTLGYDGNGNQTSSDAPLTRNTLQGYDALNRVTQITDPNNGVTALGYDADDNLTSVTDPRNLVTSYGYTGFDELATQTSPDTGNTTNTYDSAGNLSTVTDARGAIAAYSYDALNRVTSVAYSLGGSTDQSISFTYDAGTYGTGHLTGAADANHSIGWTYDALGRVTAKSQTVSGVTLPVAYGYTNADLTSVTTPSGQSVAYGYNSNHQIVSVSVNGTTVLNSATYEPLGPVNGWAWGNGTAVSRTYDADGKVSQIADSGTKTFSYDNAFRITGISDTSTGASNWTYGYDALDRITSGSSSAGTTRGWTYDANGNRLTETGSAPSTYSISPTSNQITGITGSLGRTYGYDAAGNTLSYSTTSATYNDAGRMETVTQTGTTETLIYNALGQRIETSGGAAGTVLYDYDEAGHLLGEYDGGGNLIEETVWLGDVPVATLRPHTGGGIDIFYVHADQLNTPRAVTRPSDSMLLWSWYSDPFGTDAANENPAGAGTFKYNLRFPGQVFDGQAGLHQNYFRDYDPATGRYPTGDPGGLAGGLNPYSYAGANPISNFDPLGLYCTSGGGWTSCSYPGGPSFKLPTPQGFPADINAGNRQLYHKYDVQRALGCADPQDVLQSLINNPTPGSPNPATPGGTPNDAPVPFFGDNPVTSYLTTDLNTGAPLVVNITGPGSAFNPGYVAREVVNGVAHTYGEGLNAWQSPSISAEWIQNIANQLLWGRQMSGFIEKAKQKCGCQQ